MLQRNMDGQFNRPSGLQYEDVWERLIRSVRKAASRFLREHTLDDEELYV